MAISESGADDSRTRFSSSGASLASTWQVLLPSDTLQVEQTIPCKIQLYSGVRTGARVMGNDIFPASGG